MCFNRYILRRHGFGDFLIPSPKGVTFSCRGVRGGNFRTIVLCNWCNLTSAVGIKGYCVLIDFPLCFNRYILRRHGFGDFLIPSLKGITFSCRVVRGGNFCTVILCNGCNLTSAVGIKGYCVLIDFPLCFNRYILRRHGFGDFLIPSPKGVTFSCRGVRGGNFRTIVLCNWCNLTSAVGIKGYCVFIRIPHGIERQRLVFGINIFKIIYLFASVNGCPAYLRVARAGEQSAAQGKNIVVGFHIRHRTAGAVCAGEVNHLIVASDRKHGNIGRYGIAGFIAVPIFIRPIQLRVFRNAVRAGQSLGRGCSKALAVFHNDLNILGAAAERSAAKVKGNDLQPVRAQCVRVQDFKDGAETDVRAGVRSSEVEPEAGRTVPANRTVRRVVSCCVLPPRIYAIPVFDVAAVLVQHRVPLIALGRAAFYIAPAYMITSHRWGTQRIVYAAASIVLAEKQTRGIQVIPAYRMRYIVVRNKQAMFVRGGILVGFIFQ